MRIVLVSYSKPIRFVRFDGKCVNRGFPVLDPPRGRDSWCRPNGARPGHKHFSVSFLMKFTCDMKTWLIIAVIHTTKTLGYVKPNGLRAPLYNSCRERLQINLCHLAFYLVWRLNAVSKKQSTWELVITLQKADYPLVVKSKRDGSFQVSWFNLRRS